VAVTSPSLAPTWRVGAAAEPLPVPSNTADWQWQAQQAYAIATAERVNALETDVSRTQTAGTLIALATGLVGGLVAAVGYLAWRRGR
jgi:hypothetical protein